ncbi:hypothetical protein, partial [Acidovorax sp. Q11]
QAFGEGVGAAHGGQGQVMWEAPVSLPGVGLLGWMRGRYFFSLLGAQPDKHFGGAEASVSRSAEISVI